MVFYTFTIREILVPMRRDAALFLHYGLAENMTKINGIDVLIGRLLSKITLKTIYTLPTTFSRVNLVGSCSLPHIVTIKALASLALLF